MATQSIPFPLIASSRFLRSITDANWYVSPFEHPLIWEGHATIIDETAEEIEKPDAIVLSVGGGGLFCGVNEGLQRNKWQDVPVIAVEPACGASLAVLYDRSEVLNNAKTVVVIVCGGIVVDLEKFYEWKILLD